MHKLFYYELKRFLFNKFTLGLICVVVFYSYQIIRGDIILGVANTAPFSEWSFGLYLSKILPVFLVALLFFILFLYSKEEQAVRILTDSMSINVLRYRLLRYAAVTLSFIFIVIISIIYVFWFYYSIFNFTAFNTLITPVIFTIIPAFLLIFGIGLLAGYVHPKLILVLMPIMLLMGFAPLPGVFELYGKMFFVNYPVAAGVLDPTFTVPTSYLIVRTVYSIIGILMIIIAATVKKQKII